MKKAGLDRPDSWRDSGLCCLDGGLTIGGRRGYDGTLGSSRVLPRGEDGDGEREQRGGG